MAELVTRRTLRRRVDPPPTGESRPVEADVVRRPGRIRRTLRAVLIAFVFAIGLIGSYELRTFYLEARFFSAQAARLDYALREGPSERIRFPEQGPYDRRLGYAYLPGILDDLERRGYAITAQAEVSEAFATTTDFGLFPVYPAKSQAGLRLTDRFGVPLYEITYPQAVFERFEEIPPIIWRSLLHVENRTLLDEEPVYRNPAVEWTRFARALAEQVLAKAGMAVDAPGASTLATQLEKLRHSPGGRTDTPIEKFRQMASASLRAYYDGPETLEARRRIVRDYLNSMPFAAVDGYGEVTGLIDGLTLWFGVDMDSTSAALLELEHTTDPARLAAGATSLRQVLSLVLATRRPTYYLRQEAGREDLQVMVESYLRILARDSVITPVVRDAALGASVTLRESPLEPDAISFVERKAANSLRTELLQRLGATSLHDLDRFDLSARSTFDGEVQHLVSDFLEELQDPAAVRTYGLEGSRLLGAGGASEVSFAIILYEATERGNEVRVEADNYRGPFNVNRGSKLELGSSAKLRTLITYLELVEELHRMYAHVPPDSLRRLRIARGDNITSWAVGYLQRTPGVDLQTMLEAAMKRTYSAGTGESFFTGGGRHVFSNFSGADNGRIMTVAEAFRRSVNLVFIRMMRDIVAYHLHRLPDEPARMLENPADPRRAEYLERFAEKEGLQFTATYFRRYHGRSEDEMWQAFVRQNRLTPGRLAWAFRAVEPDADTLGFAGFMRRYAGASLSNAQLRSLHQRSDPTPFNWQDRGYLAGVHPLEIWLMRQMITGQVTSWADVVATGHDVRREVYQWLFRSTGREGQDLRIRSLLEEEAFRGVHARWARVGYPFETLVPSYATAIGSSADRPESLAELVGVVLRGGMRHATIRLDTLHFAAGTPYETVVAAAPPTPTRVLSEELSRVVREALLDVVENGTAVRARRAITLSDGTSLPIGGKTGTGDNRHQVFDRRGAQVGSHVLNRTSTLVFYAGDRHFGVITVYVDGPAASRYAFTSSLPAQVLKTLGPSLRPLFETPAE